MPTLDEVRERRRLKQIGYVRKYRLTHLNKCKEYDKEYNLKQRNKEVTRICQKRYQQRIKIMVLTIFGGPEPKCKKCCISDIRYLVIDHIYGGGHEERKKYGMGTQIYLHYLKHIEEYRDKLQVLCSACNLEKSRVRK